MPAELAAVLQVDQRERWAAGEHLCAEWYLSNFPDVADDPELALDLVYGEFLLREDAGLSPAVAEYLERFPELAAAFELQVDFHRALDPAATASPSCRFERTLGMRPCTSRSIAVRRGCAASRPARSTRRPPDLNLPAIPGYKIARANWVPAGWGSSTEPRSSVSSGSSH